MEQPFDESWFYAPLREVGDTVQLPAEEVFHLRKVLRVRTGRRIVATNGLGRAFLCDLEDVAGAVEATAAELLADQLNPPRLHAVISLLKGRDTEEPVAGICQLPIAAVHLVTTEHTQDFKGQDHGRLVERLRQKSLTALKQSKKTWLTEVFEPLPLKAWREWHPDPLILVHPGPDRLDELGSGPIYLLTGPEGGFSEPEVAWLLQQEQCRTLGLGATRIRGTHAPLLACGKLMGLGLPPG